MYAKYSLKNCEGNSYAGIWSVVRIAKNLKIRARIIGLFLMIITVAITIVAGCTYYIGSRNLDIITTNQLTNSVRFVANQITLLSGAYTSKYFSDKLGYVLAGEEASFREAGLEARLHLIDSSGFEIDRTNVNAQTEKKTELPDEFIKCAFKDKKGSVDVIINGKQMKVSFGYIIEKDWIYAVAVTKSSYMTFIYKLQFVMVLSGIVSILSAVALSFFGTRGIINTIRELSKTVSKADTGDLTVRAVANHGGPELRDLANNFNVMMANFESLLSEIGASIEELTKSNEELKNISLKSDKSTAHIYELTQNMADSTEEQKNFVGKIRESTDRIIETINNISSQIDNATQVSNDMISTVDIGMSDLKLLSGKMSDIEEVSTNTVKFIKELEVRSNEINKITNTIRGISDQTKLLSLNAAIEAARVGEYGLGFTVVAQEIQKLAQSSAQSALEVGTLIKEIQKSTYDVHEIAEKGRVISHEGTEIAQKTNSAFNMILNKVTETHNHINSISRNATSISGDIGAFISNTDEITQIISINAASSQEVAAEVESHHVLSSETCIYAQSLLHIADKLGEYRERFIVS